ncbi:NAD-dependent malic enzyme [Coxiella burnetii]|uniref:Malolactic enzyme n=3 Tax=Coxiella burnetii TaxID=777 RepID=Q83DB5_COXBU|nr:NAD-dependent malic enzyme [Coxiella burnetii]NP_819843.1 NAD-dependent malic enzyme [Coxiella burnetii RSA 493]AAO90357.1 NAD-dependent malic enzyme [Coxiella burnetii RSA 493]ABX77835.1 malate dehydrogenase (oxaloacetate-decarboxylating) [Coxiella burnetii RSA 331]AML49127.1 NAD-dependent malic enzyme [Coxiella burnetii]AML55062.1 NAD-dependent malic enzyme [Coxiella burnetii]ARI65656.1 NAD-dependent malic enzyme [Coxiella burnetii]
MLDITFKTDKNNKPYLETGITGKALLTIPQLNKGTAFTEEERDTFGLRGKLPNRVETLDDQVARAYLQYKSFDMQLNRNFYLNHLLDTNQVLFHRLVKNHVQEMLPTIYTPIVGNAVRAFNKRFMHPRGLYISYEDRNQIKKILNNRSHPIIDLIVVSDGEGVLGIGDQGVGAMAIPVAKLMVYTAIGGINPIRTLPILLDAGTNNEELLNDPLYLGWRHPRLSGNEYAEFIEKFIEAVQATFPQVFLHWEDFGRTNAYRNLIKYREITCSFNDDIQGTGCVALAAILAALKITRSTLPEQRIAVFGAGTAGMGITDTLFRALSQNGLSEKEARNPFWLIDRNGLLTEYSEEVTSAQQPYLRKKEEIASWKIKNPQQISLLEVIENVKPTILIGASAQSHAFDQTIVKAMAKHVEKPIIFPLSNPTDRSEAEPADLHRWSHGKALIATGSPFEDIIFDNQIFPVNQCNNYLAFPGIGLGAIAVKANRVSDNMLWSASQALSRYANESTHRLLPSIAQAQEASRQVAIAVAKTAIEEGLAKFSLDQVETLVDQQIWEPHYLSYRKR